MSDDEPDSPEVDNVDNVDKDAYMAALRQVRREARLMWRSFQAFLLVHTVFLGFLLRSLSVRKTIHNISVADFGAGVIGLLLCIPWIGVYSRSSAYYSLRMAQAREKEPAEYDLIGERGRKFAEGEEVTVEGKNYATDTTGQWLRTRRSVPILIATFVVSYFTVLWISGLYSWKWCNPAWIATTVLLVIFLSILFIGLFDVKRGKKLPKRTISGVKKMKDYFM